MPRASSVPGLVASTSPPTAWNRPRAPRSPAGVLPASPRPAPPASWTSAAELGSDALAFAEEGLEVVAVESDPGTAVLAQANLGARGRVLVADAEEVASGLLGPGTGVFADPARRTSTGRSWRVEDFRPRWGFVTGLLSGDRVACVKAGPGLPRQLIPEDAAAVWVSDRGDLVECSLWAGLPASRPGSRSAVLLPEGIELVVEKGRTPRSGRSAATCTSPTRR